MKMIHFAIIAAGEGSRLKEEGVDLPKPLLTLNGVPMIARLIRIFADQGAPVVHIIINNHSPELKAYLTEENFDVPISLIIKDTPSSLHSFHALIEANPDWEACCLTTTDTIFKEEDFASYLHGFRAAVHADAYMGITPFIDDESPLYVKTDQHQNILSFQDQHTEDIQYVSGGIYGLRKNAIELVKRSVEEGNTRMRNYQRDLLLNHLNVKGHIFGKVVDVDHLKDKEMAEAFLLEKTHLVSAKNG
ncbi:NTP transferase domain-containing protein [Sphingobacterium sp.]|uniref:nucleotidyltransferase family protein n=2 Tax=unclassified Sphingobacterium TaxID=2609468 RepID=UPI0028A60245|nr:NTP transferase domain-containing protein [Sphingobacterium sp.]